MDIDLTPVLQAMVTLVAALISAVIVPWIRQKYSQEQLTELKAWTEIAVAAAEQLYQSMDGEAKKSYVMRYLEEKGYDVKGEDIENAIEAAVLQLHSQLYGTGKAE